MGLIGIDKLVTMFILGKIAWKRMKEGKTQYFCDAVDTLMIPYKIDINKFIVNMDCFRNSHSYSYTHSQASTKSMVFFAEQINSWELPLGFPDWFYGAFPDVAYWIIKENGLEDISEELPELNDGSLIDPISNKIRVSNLKKVIDLYLRKSRKQLETIG